MNTVLDNPIWHALNSSDSDKNIGNTEIAWFDASIAPFIGMPNWEETSQRKLLQEAPSERSWFLLIADEVQFIPEYNIVFSIPLYQFVCNNVGPEPKTKYQIQITPLNSSHVEEMIALTAMTKPGPFMQRTIEFGNYHGIFVNRKLVAMGGERMHINNYTEISAICTHPDFQGQGFGAAITHFLAKSVIRKGQTPFLHARVDNNKAMDVYRRQGFEMRKKICFYIFKRK
jgi:ribosomal protein S18 acetylase RimI-like enzyme